MEIWLFLSLFVLFLGAGLIVLKIIEKKRASLVDLEGRSLLQITVSKTNELGPLAAEQMFASLHGLFREIGHLEKLAGHTQEYFSFEIANINGQIRFFAWMPTHILEFVENQLYAQYPDIEIIEVEDYVNSVGENATFAGLELAFDKPGFYPIRRTEDFVDSKTKTQIDSLSAITSTLGKITPGDQCWIQVIARPSDNDWQVKGVRHVDNIRAGKKESFFSKLPVWVKAIALPFRLLYTFINFFIPKADEGPSKKVELTDTQKLECDEIMEKTSKLGFQTTVRLAYVSEGTKSERAIKTKLQSVSGAFKQFNVSHLNSFKAKPMASSDVLRKYTQRSFSSKPLVLNTEEISNIFHLPNLSVQTPGIVWVDFKHVAPPVNLPLTENTPKKDLTLIGETKFRGTRKKFGMKLDDRRRHTYIIGKTGMGKSVLMENMVYTDIMNGHGVAYIDPHGEAVKHIMSMIPRHRLNDVIIIDPSDQEYPVGFNVFDGVEPIYYDNVTSGIVGIFHKLFEHSWGPRMEYIMQNSVKALLESESATMLAMTRILIDSEFRAKIVENLQDPVVKTFWETEYASIPPNKLQETISPIQNKVGQFLANRTIRNIVGQTKNKIDLREAMDSRKIILVNLCKGVIGDIAMQLLGSMFITRFQIAAFSRADVEEDQRPDFMLYVDEFQNFATNTFATILSEARKYHLNLTLANQYVEQMPDEVKDAVFGNVGSMISFQVGYDDAEYFTNQYQEVVSANDLVGLSKYHIYTRLMIDGLTSRVFSAKTLPPLNYGENPETSKKVMMLSRERYSTKKDIVEDKIDRWLATVKTDVTPQGGAKKPRVDVEAIVKNMEVGNRYQVKVNKVVNFGIFVEFQGAPGLVHTSQIPKNLLKNVEEEFKKDDILDVKLIEITDDHKLVFSLKQLADPDKSKKKDTPSKKESSAKKEKAPQEPDPKKDPREDRSTVTDKAPEPKETKEVKKPDPAPKKEAPVDKVPQEPVTPKEPVKEDHVETDSGEKKKRKRKRKRKRASSDHPESTQDTQAGNTPKESSPKPPANPEKSTKPSKTFFEIEPAENYRIPRPKKEDKD